MFLDHPTLHSRLQGVQPFPSVEGFRGIPYGTLKERWTRSQLAALPTEFDARSFGPKCPQPGDRNCTLDFGPYLAFPNCGEDEFRCLNLNVYRPVGQDNLPVLFWIHGGSLRVGAGSDPIWDPAELVRWALEAGTPIVAVSINYRLGPFGFVSPKVGLNGAYNAQVQDAPNEEVSKGNYGFHDQTIALRWVQDHIKGFGGDPSRVTVAGESAGGCSTHAQLIRQTLTGEKLLHRAIMESGNLAVMGFWNRDRLDQIWDDACHEAGLKSLEEMRALPAEKLLLLPAVDINGFGVQVDGIYAGPPATGSDGGFVETDPGVPVMHGDNGDEGNIFREPSTRPGIMEDLNRIARQILGEDKAAQFLRLYGVDNVEGLSQSEIAHRLHRIPEDARFYLPSAELARVWPKAAFYHVSVKSPFASSRYNQDSYHTLELLYLFGNFDCFLQDEKRSDDLRLGREIRTTWLKFIYGQDPWDGCYQGKVATFDHQTKFGTYDDSRGWTDRNGMIKELQRIGAAEVVDLATRAFP